MLEMPCACCVFDLSIPPLYYLSLSACFSLLSIDISSYMTFSPTGYVSVSLICLFLLCFICLFLPVFFSYCLSIYLFYLSFFPCVYLSVFFIQQAISTLSVKPCAWKLHCRLDQEHLRIGPSYSHYTHYITHYLLYTIHIPPLFYEIFFKEFLTKSLNPSQKVHLSSFMLPLASPGILIITSHILSLKLPIFLLLSPITIVMMHMISITMDTRPISVSHKPPYIFVLTYYPHKHEGAQQPIVEGV